MGNTGSNTAPTGSLQNLTQLVQDVQYTSALRGMTEQEKQAYFNSQKENLMNTLLSDREATFQKTHTDALRNNAIQNSLLFYQQRNRDLDELGTTLKGQNVAAIQTAAYNADLATRQYEVNEWSYNNKLDTLFVFQILFVTLLFSAILVYLHKAGFFSAAFLGLIVGIVLFINVMIIANRATYTDKTRNRRYWNKKNYPGYQLATGEGPSICPTPSTPESSAVSQPATAPAPPGLTTTA
jgi:hypothetical protein